MAQYVLAETAADDLGRIIRYISFHNPAASVKMSHRFVKTFDHLAFSPHAGRIRSELAPHLRSFPVRPYTVFYHITPEGIAIDRILHGSRNITTDFFPSSA